MRKWGNRGGMQPRIATPTTPLSKGLSPPRISTFFGEANRIYSTSLIERKVTLEEKSKMGWGHQSFHASSFSACMHGIGSVSADFEPCTRPRVRRNQEIGKRRGRKDDWTGHPWIPRACSPVKWACVTSPFEAWNLGEENLKMTLIGRG